MPRQARLTGNDGPPLYTIGHSTRSLDELVELLLEHDVAHLFDVRRFPNSKRHPHFNEGNLEDALAAVGIGYAHLEALGGYRDPPADDSPNAGWESKGFRAYADHALTEAFQDALEQVLARCDELDSSGEGYACVMCAEKVHGRCHRRILSDHVLARGQDVRHIIEKDHMERHEITEFARVRGEDVVYPGS